MKQKNIYLFLIVIATLAFYTPNVYAWDDCPKGEVNDPYPGECSQYVDTDNDGICDRSQSTPEDRVTTNTTNEEKSTYTAVPIIENETDNNTVTTTTSPTDQSQNINTTKKVESNSKYNFWLISIILIIIYLISFVLSKTNKISVVAHRKIWNVMLLITFLISGITGLLLTIKIENPGIIALPQNFLFLHVEFGIVMALISIFHILWHWKYYINMFKPKSKIPIQENNNDNNISNN